MDVANGLDRSLRNEANVVFYRLAKRLLDIFLSSVLLICLAPLFGFCALIVRLDSSGPVIFRQQRVGKNGRVFTMLKFRTMYQDNDPSIHRAYAIAHINGQASPRSSSRGTVYKLVGDKRITSVGRWLRRTSLDELPQLWNVLRGDMSLVGPRPALAYELEHYQPDQLKRLTVEQGITGLWQISGRNGTSFQTMIVLDLTYVREQSLALDLAILAKTLPAVLLGRGA